MTKALDCALRLLTRREHGSQELVDKLQQKGYCFEDATQAVLKCQQSGLQSDTRFAEAVLRSKMRQGYGPLRIRQELQAKHVDPELISELLQSEELDWHEVALNVWKKKAPSEDDLDFSGLQKIKRFMLYRGFSSDIIQGVIDEIGIE